MGKFSREKGKRGEREVCTILKAADIPAKRISMNESNHEDEGDIQIAEIWKGSVKLGGHVPVFLKKARGNCEFLFTRRDGEKWDVTMSLDFFLKTYI